LSGPFDIETAEPGDVLLVEIQDVQPFQDQPWGFTGVFAKENGGGFLDEIYPKAFVESPPPPPGVFILISLRTVQKQFGILKASSVPVAIFPVSALLG
jgi:acetamidase/formamidase